MNKDYTLTKGIIYFKGAKVTSDDLVNRLNEYARVSSEASEKRESTYKEIGRLQWEAEKSELGAQVEANEKDKFKSMLKFIVDKL